MTHPLSWLLARTTDPELADSILGDLSELARRRGGSPLKTTVWFSCQLAAIVWQASLTKAGDSMRTFHTRRLMPHWHEIRHGARTLRNHPWYAGAAIGVVALSAMLATTVFAVVAQAIFPSLPYERPDGLYRVGAKLSDEALARGHGRMRNSAGGGLFSLRDVADLAASSPEARVAAYTRASGGRPAGAIGPWQPIAAPVDARFFDVLGAQPLLGGFQASDFEPAPGGPTPALLTYDVWQSRFGGRPDVVGVVYESSAAPQAAPSRGGFDSLRYRVAGVLPPAFLFPSDDSHPELLTALASTPAERSDRSKRLYDVIARVDTTEARPAVQARFDAAAAAGARELNDPSINGGAGPNDRAVLVPIREWLGYGTRMRGRQVLAVALVLVLLGCVNVSGLVAARSVDRARELALRRALGAGARDVAAVVFVESALIVGIGAAIGASLSGPLLTFVVRVMPAGIGPREVPAIDWRVGVFALLVCAASILVVSVWPIVRSLRQDARPTVAEGGLITTARSRSRSAALSLQVAMGLMLTVTGAFVVVSLLQAMSKDLGYTSDHLVVIEGVYPPGVPATWLDPARETRLVTLRTQGARELDDLIARVGAVPGVVSAGATHATILRSRGSGSGYGDNYAITAGFVEALRPRLVAGRWPTDAEIRQGARVAVMSEDAARRFLAGGSPIGRTIQDMSRKGGTLEVVGVSEEARYRAWDSIGSSGQVFSPYRATAIDPSFTLAVRVTEARDVLAWAMAEAQRPSSVIRLTSAALADDLVRDTIRARQFQSWVFGTFALAALAIVGVGILGLAAMTSARRRREMGIRLTLGATRGRIVLQLLREPLVSVVLGIVLGGAAGLVASAVLAGSYVYGLMPWDVRVWGAAIATILATATLGLLIPARRASRVDPVAALRCD